MRNITEKIMIVLACAIIMLHAVVPHHHDDCCGAAECFFGTEHHEHEHHHNHDEGSHPFDICHLQDMLSHLALTSRHEELTIADLLSLQSHDYLQLAVPAMMEGVLVLTLPSRQVSWPLLLVTTTQVPFRGTMAMRAPPVC